MTWCRVLRTRIWLKVLNVRDEHGVSLFVWWVVGLSCRLLRSRIIKLPILERLISTRNICMLHGIGKRTYLPTFWGRLLVLRGPASCSGRFTGRKSLEMVRIKVYWGQGRSIGSLLLVMLSCYCCRLRFRWQYQSLFITINSSYGFLIYKPPWKQLLIFFSVWSCSSCSTSRTHSFRFATL